MNKSPVNQQPVAKWFRYCLLLTAIFNLFGAIRFAPPVYYPADTVILPKDAIFVHWVIASWILILGVSYAWLAIKAKVENFFIAVAAAFKIAIAILFFAFCFRGDLPLTFLFGGFGDLFFAFAFIFWLFQTQQRSKIYTD
ncbi:MULTISPECIES: hypothetical protein [unclassified Anabaena]|uniref:hypothetical protein n=1 Tax=unclassified Anabaena TaxID=2619674 RepID=UPI002B20C02B|nr:hypothetical protein [Anabaena sp. UHCC 0399]MEA5566734.1 hypothetical protein [Anabaena sp. UHCC 0399]